MAHNEHPSSTLITTAIAATALWQQRPLAADAYPADWAPVLAAETIALRRFPDSREVIRGQVQTSLRQIIDGINRGGAFGPAERRVALEFLAQVEQRMRKDRPELHDIAGDQIGAAQ